jgi:hypothetical protein
VKGVGLVVVTVVTWIETNNTKTNDTPVISIDGEDFWLVFEPLLK